MALKPGLDRNVYKFSTEKLRLNDVYFDELLQPYLLCKGVENIRVIRVEVMSTRKTVGK